MEQPSYYTVIPAFVRYDDDLLRKPKSILLYGEIAALSNQKGYCWANNSYFSKRLKVSGRMIQDYLDILVKKGYVARALKYKPGTKQVDKRILSIASRPGEIHFTTSGETDFVSPGEADFADNITSINTTSNNKPLTDGHHSLQDVFNLWQQSWGFPNGIAQQDLTEWNNEFGADLLYYCIEYALRRNISSKGADRYLYKKLNAYKEQGIKTVAGAKKDDERHEQQMSREYQGKRRGYNAPQVRETLPDWWGKDYSKSSSGSDYQVPDDSQDVMPDD